MLKSNATISVQPGPGARRWNDRRRSGRATLLVVGAALLATAETLAADVPREYAVKAAFLYNFTQFVEWPASVFADSKSPFVVGVIGNDRFAEVLENTLASKSVAGRAFAVRRFTTVAESVACQVLFVSESQDGIASDLLEKARQQPVLTVGESDAFADGGGGIRFFTEGRKMRFELNMKSVTEAGLKVSGKLQQLAHPRQN